PVAHGLDREILARGELHRAGGQVEALAVPLIDILRVVEEMSALFSRLDRVVTNLDALVLAAIDAGAEMARHELRAEADAEIGLPFLERDADPLRFCLDEGEIVIGAHRPAEDHGGVMLHHGFGQGIAERGAPDVENAAPPAQLLRHPAGIGALLMEHDEDAACHAASMWAGSCCSARWLAVRGFPAARSETDGRVHVTWR